MLTTTPKEVTDEVARIAKEALVEHYGDRLVFDPVVVVPMIDYYGDEYLHIYSVYEGTYEILDTKWSIGFARRMMPELREVGVEDRPNTSFVPTDQWPELEQILSRRTS